MSKRGFSGGQYYAVGKYGVWLYILGVFGLPLLAPKETAYYWMAAVVSFFILHLDAMYGMKVREIENQLESLSETSTEDGEN